MVISFNELTPPPCNGFGAPVFQTLGGGDKNGVSGKGLGTRLGMYSRIIDDDIISLPIPRATI